MTVVELERRQVWIYLVAVVAGVVLGERLSPELPGAIIYIPLLVLLYATFVQVPLIRLSTAFGEWRFLTAALVVNFALVPVIVSVLMLMAPSDRAIILGVLLVLLVPCTDWFIVFTRLGAGDARLALMATPVLLIGQFLLLPLYLGLLPGEQWSEIIRPGPFVRVFIVLIAVPLIAAGLTQFWASRSVVGHRFSAALNVAPVPLLALVMFLIALAGAGEVVANAHSMVRVVFIFALYLTLAPPVAILTARLLGLPIRSERTLIFSAGTRNSFVVLPFALALPAGWELAAAVIVLQTLVELLGIAAYVQLVPMWGAGRD